MSDRPYEADAITRGLPSRDPGRAARHRALDYLQSVWKPERQRCPICGENDWGVNDAGTLPVRDTDRSGLGLDQQRVYPLVPIACKICGYTFFINEKWILTGGTPSGLRED